MPERPRESAKRVTNRWRARPVAGKASARAARSLRVRQVLPAGTSPAEGAAPFEAKGKKNKGSEFRGQATPGAGTPGAGQPRVQRRTDVKDSHDRLATTPGAGQPGVEPLTTQPGAGKGKQKGAAGREENVANPNMQPPAGPGNPPGEEKRNRKAEATERPRQSRWSSSASSAGVKRARRR